MTDSSKPRILCVDDEANVLSALERQLRREFEVFTAEDARAGMRILVKHGPFPIVMSDMRMPLVDGASFLAKVKEKSPESVRVLLTGQADLEAAIRAVNRGQIFRFLNKPCRREDLLAALHEALEQYNLRRAEQVLLTQTLRGSIQALVEILSLARPMAFGRAERAKSVVAELCRELKIEESWPIEVAALLSQIGSITLMDETLEKIHRGQTLDPQEEAAVERLPELARRLLRHIPRLEPVLEILEHMDKPFEPERRDSKAPKGTELPIGSRLLRLALDYDTLENQGKIGRKAVEVLRGRQGRYDPEALEALARLRAHDDEGREVRELYLQDLRTGMILAEDCVARSGALLVARGQVITEGLKMRLHSFADNVGLREPILVAIPPELPAEEEAPAEGEAIRT